MHRWTLLATLVAVAPACKDIDPAGPVTGVSLDTPANPDESGSMTQSGESTMVGVTEAPDTATGSTGPAVTSAETGDPSTSSPTSASSPSTDPTNGPDPTETAFILPMTDEGGDPSGDPSSDPSSDPSGDPTGDPTFGQCGWSSQANYYDCASNGAVPGTSDPSATYPIDCPDGLQAGAPCDEQNGPIGNVGCCDPGGTLYYCTGQGNTIIQEECGP
jgi:hypothetical protein